MPGSSERVLITGATGIIGGALARLLASPGRRMALNFKSSVERAERLKSEMGSSAEVHLLQADIAEAGAPEKLVGRCAELIGGIDLLVHCAAEFEKTPFGAVTEEAWGRSIAVNMKAPFFLAQAAGMRMKESGGAIVFVTDVAAARPYAGYLPYCMAKAGLESLVRGLARSLAPAVTVNAVAPYIVTRQDAAHEGEFAGLVQKTPMRRAQGPDEIAVMIKAVAESGSMTGQVVRMDSGRLLR